jgi:hypothetical protein
MTFAQININDKTYDLNIANEYSETLWETETLYKKVAQAQESGPSDVTSESGSMRYNHNPSPTNSTAVLGRRKKKLEALDSISPPSGN